MDRVTLEGDLQAVRGLLGDRIAFGVPQLDVGGGVSMGNLILVEGHREARHEFAFQLTSRALGTSRRTVIVAPFERESHVRLRALLTPYGQRGRSVRVDGSVPVDSHSSLRDVLEISEALSLDVAGVDTATEAVRHLLDGPGPLGLLTLLDVDAAPGPAEVLCERLLVPVTRATTLPGRVRQLARVLGTVVLVTVGDTGESGVTEWGRAADRWLRVRGLDDAGDQWHVVERSVVGDIVEDFGGIDVRRSSSSDPDDVWSVHRREQRRDARFEDRLVDVEVDELVGPVCSQGDRPVRFRFRVGGVEVRRTERARDWLSLTVSGPVVATDVLVFDDVRRSLDPAPRHGDLLEVEGTVERTDERIKVIAKVLRRIDPSLSVDGSVVAE